MQCVTSSIAEFFGHGAWRDEGDEERSLSAGFRRCLLYETLRERQREARTELRRDEGDGVFTQQVQG
ncbi:MAG: hypothetical protein RMY29_010315 [Nostoc sp. CreGUA01]|nr:hypothetical protein [Nostoc sp. CreGUA01]